MVILDAFRIIAWTRIVLAVLCTEWIVTKFGILYPYKTFIKFEFLTNSTKQLLFFKNNIGLNV
jgi:hypothetical protein